jgi:hypothetical protein
MLPANAICTEELKMEYKLLYKDKATYDNICKRHISVQHGGRGAFKG